MSFRDKIVKIVVEVSRVVVGAVFAFSGFVKAVDPYGFVYKMEDYLIHLNLTELFPLALPLAIFMVAAEFSLGVLLILGVYRKWTTIFIGLFMLFFTPLTLWIAIANPVADCGCFGDALIISNWETFFKNIVLSILTLMLVIYWRKITPLYSRKTALFAAAFVILFGVLFALRNVYNLPVFDFRPYKIGSNISEKMHVNPEDADVYENIFIYSKDGVEKEFTEENYPWDDSTWVYVDMRTQLVKEGVKPEIEDFAIELIAGEGEENIDITENVLAYPDYSFFMVSYLLDEMNERFLNRFKQISDYARSREVPFYCLTSSTNEQILKWKTGHEVNFDFCHADERVLKTMVRSNPGLMLFHNGTVIGKWSDGYVPQPEKIEELISGKSSFMSDAVKMLIIALLLIIPFIVLKIVDIKFTKINHE